MKNDKDISRLSPIDKRLSKLLADLQKDIESTTDVDSSCLEEYENLRIQIDYMRHYAFSEKKDPYRQNVFDDIVTRLLRLSRDVEKCSIVKSKGELSSMKRRASENDFDMSEAKNKLENYVSSLTMSSITGEDEDEIITEHFKYITRLFDYIVTGRQWNESKRDFFSETLSSPVVDSTDAMVLVSAIMISSLLVTDEFKIETLLNIYAASKDADVRFRALAGWVFALHSAGRSNSRIDEKAASLLKDKETIDNLVEMQVHMTYTAEAQKDTQALSSEIISAIKKSGGMHLNRFGFLEEDNDSEDIENILRDDEEEDAMMGDIYESYEKLKQMEREGVDVFFGGFAQMKGIDFFYEMINWFYPYNPRHPAISKILPELEESGFIRLVESFPFCNSDRYSFMFALSRMFKDIPDGMKEAVLASAGLDKEEVVGHIDAASLSRRMYIQDLFRFFKLHSSARPFGNPFAIEDEVIKGFFFADDFMNREDMAGAKHKIARFLMKRRPYGGELDLLFNSYESGDYADKMLRAAYLMHKGSDESVVKALDIYREMYAAEPENEKVLSGLVKSLSRLGRSEEACRYSEKLLASDPGSNNKQLNHSVLLIKCKRYEEAGKMLYKLNYENPSNLNVTRVLAWCLMFENKKEKACEMYEKLMSSGNVTPSDNLNAGLAHWISWAPEKAAGYFARYAEAESLQKLAGEISAESELLQNNDIIESDVCMMLDLVEERTKES